jgi:hypothetical protein
MHWPIADMHFRHIPMHWPKADIHFRHIPMHWPMADMHFRYIPIRWPMADIHFRHILMHWPIADMHFRHIPIHWPMADIHFRHKGFTQAKIVVLAPRCLLQRWVGSVTVAGMGNILPAVSASTPSAPLFAATAPDLPWIDPVKGFYALSTPLRWRMLQKLATGEEVSALAMSFAMKHKYENVVKQLRVLLASGMVASKPGADRRFGLYYIPAARRQRPNVLEYSFCTVHLPPAQ